LIPHAGQHFLELAGRFGLRFANQRPNLLDEVRRLGIHCLLARLHAIKGLAELLAHCIDRVGSSRVPYWPQAGPNCSAVAFMESLVSRSKSDMPCIWSPNMSRICAENVVSTSVSILLTASP
jgi:hypothetical protein